MREQRAVSEVLGFILVASIILSTLSIVFLFGLGGLQDVRDDERVDNTERAFGILAENIEDSQRHGAPSRATEIKLAEAGLEFGPPTRLTVNVSNTTNDPDYSVSLQPIVYTSGTESEILYENGAIIRQESGGGAVLKRAPQGTFRDGVFRTASIPFIETREAGSASVGGSTTALVRSDLAARDIMGSNTDVSTAHDFDGDPGNEFKVTYTIETTEDRAPVWEEELNGRIPDGLDLLDADGDGSFTDDPACERSGGTVTCQLAVERLYVSVSRVDVTFSS